jgi:aryl-alcohol dehydrogenase-like predicted oxidoreductase
MKTKSIANNKVKVSALGLGCMGMSEFYGTRDDEESIRTIHRATELGLNLIDTADMYGPYHNEELVGKAIADRRDMVFLCTKFGIIRDNDPQKRSINGRPEYVQKACEASLRRLKTNTIDLYYLHRVDPSTRIEETVEAMGRLVQQGKVGHIGLSEVSVETLKRAHKVHPIAAVQSEYSLWTRDPEEGILETCRELGIAFIAYSPLGRGFLSGSIKKMGDLSAEDYRRQTPRFQGANFAKNLAVVEMIKNIALEKEVTASQLALAWVAAQGENIIPLVGTKKVAYIEENVRALDIILSPEDLQRIEKVAPKGFAEGARYPESMMSSLNR